MSTEQIHEPIRLKVDDTGISVDGQPVHVSPGQQPEEAAIARAAQIAQDAGRSIVAVVDDPDGDPLHLVVHPDGTSEVAAEPATAPTGPDSTPSPTEAGAATGPQDHPFGSTGPASAGRAEPAATASTSQQRLNAQDLLTQAEQAPPQRARTGWRGTLVRATGLPLPPSPDESARAQDLALAQTQFPGPRTVMVVNPKGGSRKTTSTLLLGAALGVARGGGVLAWDNNETRGTMGWRSARADAGGTARTLLRDAPALSSTAGRLGDLDRYVHHQGGVRFDVLPSDDIADLNAEMMTGTDFTTLHQLLQRFYRLILVDTGNNIRAANWRASAAAADLLVITTTVREDTGTSAAWMIDALQDSSHAHLVANAVTLLHQAGPRTDARLRERLHQHFAERTAAVVDIPYEPSLVDGARIDYEALSPAGTKAWLHAAATVAQRLAAVPEPRL